MNRGGMQMRFFVFRRAVNLAVIASFIAMTWMLVFHPSPLVDISVEIRPNTIELNLTPPAAPVAPAALVSCPGTLIPTALACELLNGASSGDTK